MRNIDRWINKNFKDRGLIRKNEPKTTIVQIIGFWLMGFGVAFIVYFLLLNNEDPGAIRMAISFFLIMLGFSFAFPELLKGDKSEDLSTMRIVVFMMVNVICLLLIKIGWDAKSLTEIGLNEYWMGVIAFVFGAKATQAFFESNMATPKSDNKLSGSENVDRLFVLIKRKTELQKEIDILEKLISLTGESSPIAKSQKVELENKMQDVKQSLNSVDLEINTFKSETT